VIAASRVEIITEGIEEIGIGQILPPRNVQFVVDAGQSSDGRTYAVVISLQSMLIARTYPYIHISKL
jgi:hypothetical protein